MKQNSQVELWKYAEMALRRKWLIIITFLIAVSISLVYSLSCPNVYKASTLILVEAQQ